MELASERRRTEDLCKLVESAKDEKEAVVKGGLLRLEEKIAQLVEEKSHEALPAPVVQRQDANIQTPPIFRQDANIQTDQPLPSFHDARLDGNDHTRETAGPLSASERQASCAVPITRQEAAQVMGKCQCDSLQRQVARVEKEMQLLKQRNISFQKNASASKNSRKKSSPIKAKRESWWIDSDIESSTDSTVSSSYSDWRASSTRGRSRSLTNLYAARDSVDARTTNNNNIRTRTTPVQRARGLLYKNQVHRRAVMRKHAFVFYSSSPMAHLFGFCFSLF